MNDRAAWSAASSRRSWATSGSRRRPAGFYGVPRGTAHGFANAGPDPVHALALALPGGVEELFAEQAAYLSSVQGPPDPVVLGEIGSRHGALTLGPPIRSNGAAPTSPAGQ